jgi:hypothetical protein
MNTVKPLNTRSLASAEVDALKAYVRNRLDEV